MSQEITYTYLQTGVKTIGIGKHGSKKLPEELIDGIVKELKQGFSPPILIGAFFGAVMMKEIEPYYVELESVLKKGALKDASLLWDSICSDTSPKYKDLGVKLINKESLSIEEAEALGDFLFSDEGGEAFRGLAVSILRIRYETDEEYHGLYNAIVKNEKPFSDELLISEKSIQLSEPFDGVEHSYMITPLLANEFQKRGFQTIVSCGRSSGPKVTLNTWDIYTKLGVNPEFGILVDQKTHYPLLDNWVEKRLVIMKRPFLATLEKVLNPAKAKILITSVFHIPYLEKMATLGFMAGFEAVIVLKRGLEGSLAASLVKSTGIYCALKKSDGTIVTQSFDGGDEEFSSFKEEEEESVENLSLDLNITLIENYTKQGVSGNDEFDKRVKYTCELFLKGLNWVESFK